MKVTDYVRMEGLVLQDERAKFVEAAFKMTKDLMNEGFDGADCAEYLNEVVKVALITAGVVI